LLKTRAVELYEQETEHLCAEVQTALLLSSILSQLGLFGAVLAAAREQKGLYTGVPRFPLVNDRLRQDRGKNTGHETKVSFAVQGQNEGSIFAFSRFISGSRRRVTLKRSRFLMAAK
jgi:hypothetical protein